ncbi:hypothetical protein JCM6882_007620 [Rhodosporidiobolus microsporus]
MLTILAHRAFRVKQAPITVIRLLTTAFSSSLRLHFLPLGGRLSPSRSPSHPLSAFPYRAFVGSSGPTPAGDPLTHSELSSHPSTRKLLDWQRESPRARSVEIIKRRKWDDEEQGEWEVEVYLQDTAASEGTDLREGSLIAKGVNEVSDDALTEAAEEALDLLKLAEKKDYPPKE